MLPSYPVGNALRCAVADRLAVPSGRSHTVSNRACLVAAPKVWNSLQDDIISSASLYLLPPTEKELFCLVFCFLI